MPDIVCKIIEVSLFSFVNKEPLYLMLRRSKSEKLYPDAWQIVTGTIEHGETALQASLREIKEETGYTPVKFWIVPYMNTFYSVPQDTVHHTVIFAGQVPPNTNPVLSAEHYQFGWFTVEKAKQMCVWPGQRKAIDIIHEYIVRGTPTAELSEITL
ncbi:MAG: NUDIX domain-containing protein [Bacteroidetes bacterium]|nr:NUDIX domain-containing protein [Bacteroidota bacterium]